MDDMGQIGYPWPTILCAANGDHPSRASTSSLAAGTTSDMSRAGLAQASECAVDKPCSKVNQIAFSATVFPKG